MLRGDSGVLQRVKADRVPSTPPAATFLSHQPRARLSCDPPIGPSDRGRFPRSHSSTYANCQRSSDRSIIQSRFQALKIEPEQGAAGRYRAISSEILVWTSGGKLMCYCDERFSVCEGRSKEAKVSEIRSVGNYRL